MCQERVPQWAEFFFVFNIVKKKENPMGTVTYITEEGLRKMKEELERMTKIERPAISKSIGEDIEKGDISENAEYDAAKDAQ